MKGKRETWGDFVFSVKFTPGEERKQGVCKGREFVVCIKKKMCTTFIRERKGTEQGD